MIILPVECCSIVFFGMFAEDLDQTNRVATGNGSSYQHQADVWMLN